MQRLIEKQVLKWKDSVRRKPLILRGARQVGKTWLIQEFLGKYFENVAVVDLEERRDAHQHFEGSLAPGHILKGIELITGRILPGKTLLFFDEIQTCPRAIMALRYFYEKMPELHVVAAGSLLEFALGEISVPVGRLQFLHLHPMTFYEYLLAMNKEAMAETLLEHPRGHEENIREVVCQELKTYFLVGGMPESVKAFRDTNSLVEASQVQDEILESYRQDFHKYSPRVSHECLNTVLSSVSKSIGDQLKYSRLDLAHSYQTNRKALHALSFAKILHKILACDPSGLPLGASANSQKFKACFLDIGLLQRMAQLNPHHQFQEHDLLSLYRGRLAEQFVAQEILAWHEKELFYWSRDTKSSNAEVDYLALRGGSIYPVEVKAGPAGRLKSLHLMLDTYPMCKQGWVLQSGAYKELPEQKLVFWPLYATPHLGDRHQLPT